MASKPLFAALALTAGIAALAAPTLLSAHDRGGRWGGTMGFGMMGDAGAGPGAGFDFAKVDANGDGKITSEELAAWRQAGVAGIDADGDHLISAEELAAKMMAEAQVRIEERAKDRVAAQDANGDGKLSVEELVAPRIGTRLFERADADGDGAVSEAELQAMQQRMAAMAGQRGGRMGPRGPGMEGCGMEGMMPGGQMHGHGGWFGGDGGWGGGMMPGNGAGDGAGQ